MPPRGVPVRVPHAAGPVLRCPRLGRPSQLTAVRNESTTPLQALELLNNPFVLRQCDRLAERLRRASPELEDQIRVAFLAAYGRPPAAEELSLLASYAARHGC